MSKHRPSSKHQKMIS